MNLGRDGAVVDCDKTVVDRDRQAVKRGLRPHRAVEVLRVPAGVHGDLLDVQAAWTSPEQS